MGKTYLFTTDILGFLKKGEIKIKELSYEFIKGFGIKEKEIRFDAEIQIGDTKLISFDKFQKTLYKMGIKNFYNYGEKGELFLKTKK